MRILLNGESKDLPAPLTVHALLTQLEIDPRLVAVEVNRVVVKRARYADTVVEDGAEVEIVAFVGGGSVKGQRAKVAVRRVAAAMLIALPLSLAAQQPGAQATRPSPAQTVSEESMLVYQGWALIAAGDAAKASRHASEVLTKFPGSASVLSLAVEAHIMRGGPNAGLDVYERWLGDRKIEDPYVICRLARAVLWASARSRDAAASDALESLASSGDVEARVELTRRAYGGSIPDAKALATMDEGAVHYLLNLLDLLKSSQRSTLAVVDALVASRNRLAVPALMGLLGNLNRPDVVAAAADGLGKLGAGEAIPRLQPLAAEKNVLPPEVKWAAAGALFRLEDFTGLPLLQKSLASEHGALRLAAAEAMATRPNDGWQQVVRTLTIDPSPAVRVQAARLIAPYDLVLARGILEPELTGADQSARATAAQVMAASVASDFTTLRTLLRSPDALARVQAARRVLHLTR